MTIELTGQTLVISLSSVIAIYKFLCYLSDRYELTKRAKEYQLLKVANKNLMREVIRTTHRDAMAARKIDEDELEHVEQVYDTYSKLGGNGTAQRWIDEIRQLKRT